MVAKSFMGLRGTKRYDFLFRPCFNEVNEAPSAPFGASVMTQALSKAQLSRAPPPSSLVVPVNMPKWQKDKIAVRVERPRNAVALRRIHAVIEGVLEYGPDFEALLMEREKFNEDYAFLFDSTVSHFSTLSWLELPDSQYYRWKLYSLKNGDTPYEWRTEPFQMFVDGEWWIPPEPVDEDNDEILSNPDEEEQRQASKVKGYLGIGGQRKLVWLLRGMDGHRGSVARGMAFAMNRSDAAAEVTPFMEITEPRSSTSSS
jgi:U2-associated protein SR140